MAKKKEIRKKKQALQSRAILTRKAILESSIRILAKEGMPAFNTNRIADDTGISVGSLYQYFANKDEILEELVRNSIEERVSYVKELLQKSTQHDSPMAAVEVLIDAAMQTPRMQPEVDQILFGLNHMVLKNEKIRRINDPLIPLMKNYLKTYFPQALKKDADLVLMIVINATRGVVSLFHAEKYKGFSKKEVKVELCQLVYRYLTLSTS